MERRLNIASLQDELRVHAGEEDWEAVLAVSAELAKLDPVAADPDGLATRARGLLGLDQPERREASRGEDQAAEDQPAEDQRPRTC